MIRFPAKCIMCAMFSTLPFLLLSGCARSAATWIPPADVAQEAALDRGLTLVWSGHGKAFRHRGGSWERDDTYDYDFTVVQKRDEARWHSVKTLQRRHPDYDGRAGERTQTLFFELGFRRDGEGLASRLVSTLGQGEGRADREFREQSLELPAAGAGRFSPYTHFRIVQHYRYEEGVLVETVELLRRKDGKEEPFMRMEERAYIYARSRLPEAPTRL